MYTHVNTYIRMFENFNSNVSQYVVTKWMIVGYTQVLDFTNRKTKCNESLEIDKKTNKLNKKHNVVPLMLTSISVNV